MKSRRDAVFEGTRAAAELHDRLDTRSVLEVSALRANIVETLLAA